ncbi:hypothetical protein [Arthrobacter sp. B3I4]|uniref:hypothetical protein n=1 Tax=Arthrobacter sp. B3I4 TaxID=3042267 RepID=UPI0027D8E3A6|nr:hypothetical protein [Arthrobacter sp. B3I4]
MAGFARELSVVMDLVRAKRAGPPALARRRDARLSALVAHARTSSPFYRTHYLGLPAGDIPLEDLPPVTKPQLMAHFDDWVTDPAVTRAGLEAFVADPSLVGSRYRGRYLVFVSSGTTGHPGLFVHDPAALIRYRALGVRALGTALNPRRLLAVLRLGVRAAVVVGTGGHFAAAVWVESERRRSRRRRRALRLFSVQQPLDLLVDALNDFDPALVVGYPSALELLAGPGSRRPASCACVRWWWRPAVRLWSAGPGWRQRSAPRSTTSTLPPSSPPSAWNVLAGGCTSTATGSSWNRWRRITGPRPPGSRPIPCC